MPRLIGVIVAVVFIVVSTAVLAADDSKLCEVVVDEYGTTEWVPCCDLTDLVYPSDPTRGRGNDGEAAADPECVMARNSVRLDSAAEREHAATVATVSPVASPRDRRDPQKFFRVEAEIEDVDPELMRVGSRLRAEIVTGSIEDGIVVPSQVVFGENQAAFVYRVTGGDPERLDVKVGQRSPDLVEIVDGLEPGDRVSLAAPAGDS